MNDLPDCRPDGDLCRFLLGQLPEADAVAIEQHLSGCSRCLDTIGAMRASDTLLEAMQSQATADPHPEADVVRELMTRLSGLHPASSANPLENQVALAPPQSPEELGRLGGYRILKMLGVGGMGIVFEAEDPRLKRRVALKVMKPALAQIPANRERFLREAQATAAIEHDHVVTIHQVGEDGGVPFFAMPLLKGETLEDALRRAEGVSPPVTLPIVETLRITREIASGLAAAHAQGLTHRDVKPGNIWLEKTGRVKILDFGLARPQQDNTHLTQSGLIAGTPQYMAPEQATGKKVDHLADLFALGCVLYRLTTGRLPFDGPDSLAILHALALEQPLPPHQVNPNVPPALSDLTMRLLAKEPHARPQSATEVAAALAKIEMVVGTLRVPLPSDGTRSVPTTLTNRRAMYLTATLLLIAAPLAAWYAPAIYRIATNQGLLVIETDDDAVEVTVKQNGKLVKLVDRKTGREVNLTAGRYELVLSKGKEGLRLSTTQFTLERGGEEIVKVWREPAARVAIAPALPSGSPGPLVTAPSSPSAAPASPAKPFVILALGGRTEAQFGKLAEAIGAADSGDTIEIRGNGPFTLEPIVLFVPLTIRAGAGFQPVLQPASATPTHLLQVRARGQGVVLEGLEFRRDPQGPTPPYSLIDCHHAKLRMAHCRVQNRSASVANSFGDCELRNCEIRSTLGCSCSQDGGKLIIDRCLVTAAGSSSALSVTDWLGYGDSPQRTTITITQSTLVGTSAIFFGTKGFPGFAPAEKQELRKMPLVSLAASDSLFVADSPVLVYLFDNHRNRAAMMAIEIADVAEANDIVRKLLSWRDSNSLYATPGALLGYSLPGIPGIRHQPLADVSTVGQWEQFWGTADTHSAKQDVKFVGWEAGSKWPPSKTLTSEDFRLHQGSPGKHAGPGGSDLGVDIDQLGPGPPYERWKKTPAYQQWLKAAGQTP